MSNSIQLTHTTLKRLQQQGLDLKRLFTASGIVASQCPIQVSLSQYIHLFEQIQLQQADPLIGLKLGQVTQISQLDPASFAAVHSENLAVALERFKRYKKLICPEIIDYAIGETAVKIRVKWSNQQAFSDMMFDAFVSNFVHMLRLALAEPVHLQKITLTRAELAQGYAEFFACPIDLQQKENAFYLDADLLARPFVSYNPDLLHLLLPSLNQQITQQPLNLVQQVKTALIDMMNGNKPTLDQVAQKLAISRRTLQRQLSQQGYQYQQLLDEVRLQIACEMLQQNQLENGEIAFYLGFDEVNSFHRFFVQQMQQTPNTWRNKNVSPISEETANDSEMK